MVYVRETETGSRFAGYVLLDEQRGEIVERPAESNVRTRGIFVAAWRKWVAFYIDPASLEARVLLPGRPAADADRVDVRLQVFGQSLSRLRLKLPSGERVVLWRHDPGGYLRIADFTYDEFDEITDYPFKWIADSITMDDRQRQLENWGGVEAAD